MPEIRAEKRAIIGKKINALRREGFLPAVLYGQGMTSTPLKVPLREFEVVLKEVGETSLVTLWLDNGKSYEVLIYDVAKDSISSKPIHADFYAVRLDKPIEAKVPLEFIGESPAVKNEGGILVKVAHELEVKALPKDLPHGISVDLGLLQKIGDTVMVKDLSVPAGVVVHATLDGVVVLVEPPREEVELAPQVQEAAGPVEVKTEREVKIEEKTKEENEILE